MKRGRDGQFHSGVDRLVGFHMHVMKNTIIIKGKSEKSAFSVEIPKDELLAFLEIVIDKSAEEFDDDFATSPGGLPTALFTCIVPAKARQEAGWDLSEGWSTEKAMAAFESRLERKSGGGVSIEARQKAWDEKLAIAKSYGMPEDVFIKMNGKRPVAKEPKETGKAEVLAAIQ